MTELLKEMIRMHTEWSKLLAKIDDYIQELEGRLEKDDKTKRNLCRM